jgi:hypothetical protein
VLIELTSCKIFLFKNHLTKGKLAKTPKLEDLTKSLNIVSLLLKEKRMSLISSSPKGLIESNLFIFIQAI